MRTPAGLGASQYRFGVHPTQHTQPYVTTREGSTLYFVGKIKCKRWVMSIVYALIFVQKSRLASSGFILKCIDETFSSLSCMDGNEKVGNMIVMGRGVFTAVRTSMVM